MKIIDKIRAWIFGRCPVCGSTHFTEVKGWAKVTCKSCAKPLTWGYDE